MVHGLRDRPGTPVRPTGPANKAIVDPAAGVRHGWHSLDVAAEMAATRQGHYMRVYDLVLPGTESN
jgi:hypothetical protein